MAHSNYIILPPIQNRSHSKFLLPLDQNHLNNKMALYNQKLRILADYEFYLYISMLNKCCHCVQKKKEE